MGWLRCTHIIEGNLLPLRSTHCRCSPHLPSTFTATQTSVWLSNWRQAKSTCKTNHHSPCHRYCSGEDLDCIWPYWGLLEKHHWLAQHILGVSALGTDGVGEVSSRRTTSVLEVLRGVVQSIRLALRGCILGFEVLEWEWASCRGEDVNFGSSVGLTCSFGLSSSPSSFHVVISNLTSWSFFIFTFKMRKIKVTF